MNAEANKFTLRIAAFDNAPPNEEVGAFVSGAWVTLGTVAEIRAVAGSLAANDGRMTLAALRTLMSELPNYMAKSKAVIDAKAAIAKAEGR